VVSGAAHGAGRGTALALAHRFTDIVLVGRSTLDRPNPMVTGTLEETARAIAERGAIGHCIRADLADKEDRGRVAALVLSKFGRCDVLVNNAAYNPGGPFLTAPLSKWEAALDVTVRAAAHLCHALAPQMIERGCGRIINVGSLAAAQEVGVPQLAYAVSKAALERFTVGLAVELEGTGVAVNNIRVDEPIRSESLEKLIDQDRLPTSPRGYEPGQFGEAVAWLAEQATTVTGRILTFADLRRLGALPPQGDLATVGRQIGTYE
jgi:NAD(P)-dependent dehydrogenase (short-subunit alcohol dehydrogenase family)